MHEGSGRTPARTNDSREGAPPLFRLLQRIAAACALAIPVAALSAGYPERTVTIIVPFPIGFEVVANSSAAFGEFLDGELARWKAVVETGKITQDD